ncbi:MAG: trigger factor [Bacteriovoracia bacterium]
MQYTSRIESPSKVTRKLTITVPAGMISSRYQAGLSEVGRTAKLKGFRPGHVPMHVVKQYYGDDVKARLFQSLVEESYSKALQEHKLRPIGRPSIETTEKTGPLLTEDKDLTFTATVEILPEIEVKNYKGFALKREKSAVSEEDVQGVINNILDQRAEIVPLAGTEAQIAARQVKKHDFVDFNFDGGLVTETGVEPYEGMKGARQVEMGMGELIPGFEDNMEGMKRGETKKFRVRFPDNYSEPKLNNKEAEFTVTINDIKEKKLPELTDEFVKTMGHDSVASFKQKARESVEKNRQDTVERKLRSDLIQTLIDKNPFECPQQLIEAQSRMIVQEFVQNLQQQRFSDEMIRDALTHEQENVKKKAESQVRAGLLLEAIANKENIQAEKADLESEYKKMGEAMKVEAEKVREFYEKDAEKRENLAFRVREDKTIQFLLDQSKVKEA